MKKILLALVALGGAITTFAQTDTTSTDGKADTTTISGTIIQTDTTGKNKNNKTDTIKIGGMIIIRKPGSKEITRDTTMTAHRRKTPSNVSTNWFIVDVGFANYDDRTNYSAAAAQQFAPGSNRDWFNLYTRKSVNVNFWLFMQRMKIVPGINLKYGLGTELNNYRFDDERIRLNKNPTFITLDNTYKGLKKNKLAADYITVPMMLNFDFGYSSNRGRKQHRFGFSGGISAGYLYSARQKIKNNDDKLKTHDDFNLNKWKLSYIGELNLGPVRLYGSYAFKSMWEKGLDQTPYAVGIRFSKF